MTATLEHGHEAGPGLCVLTLQQPWAWAVVFAGKSVENRSRSLGPYRGPVAIHAGLRWSRFGARFLQRLGIDPPDGLTRGAVIGVVDLVDQHHAGDLGCPAPSGCSRWAMTHHDLPDSAGHPAHPMAHLVLANPRALDSPVAARGRLGLWRPDPDLANQIRTHLSDNPATSRKDQPR